jgi:hypothetical protein
LATAFDSEPEKITANVMTPGSALGQDDRLAVVIDPFNTGRSGVGGYVARGTPGVAATRVAER